MEKDHLKLGLKLATWAGIELPSESCYPLHCASVYALLKVVQNVGGRCGDTLSQVSLGVANRLLK